MRKLLAACLITASVAGPVTAYAAIGPKDLSTCSILKFIGVTFVMACEGT